MGENRAVTVRQPAGGTALIGTLEDAFQMAKFVAESKLFGCNNPAEAMVKIVAGLEMGFPAIASMTDIHIIEGKPSVGAHLMAAAIRRSGKYDYEIREHTDEVCSIAFFQAKGGQMKEVGIVTTTMAQARENGWNLTRKGEEKPTWRTKPKNMLFARTISDGYKFYCPDLTGGMLVYDRDEIESIPTSEVRVVAPTTNDSGTPLQLSHFNSDPERETELTVQDDGSLRDPCDALQECRQRVEALLAGLKITDGQLRKKLDQSYGGATGLMALDLPDMQRLEAELVAHKAKKKTAAPA